MFPFKRQTGDKQQFDCGSLAVQVNEQQVAPTSRTRPGEKTKKQKTKTPFKVMAKHAGGLKVRSQL